MIQTINVFENNDDEIHEVIRLPKALLILSKKQKMKIYVENHDELTYLYKTEVHVKLADQTRIRKLALSANCQ